MSKTVIIPMATGFEEIEAITIIDTLRRAENDVQTVSLNDQLEVTGAHSIKTIADKSITAIKDFDAIILPGGMPGTTNLLESHLLKELLIQANQDKKIIGAICAAPWVLAECGLLENKPATCYPAFEDKLSNSEVTQNKVVISDNIITSRGVGTALDFSLDCVKLLNGEDKANELAKAMLVDHYLN